MEIRKDYTMIPISKVLRDRLLREKVVNIEKQFSTYDELLTALLEFWLRF